MHIQIVQPIEPAAANLALVTLLASVNAHVPLAVGAEYECLMTHRAFERFDGQMAFAVAAQRPGPVEGRAAIGADVVLAVRVAGLVRS